MKRTLSSVAAAAMILGTFAPSAFAATSSTTTYSDIAGNFAATQIQQLTKDGYIHGFSDGTFRPSSAVTRGQLLAYFMNAVETVTGVTPGANSQTYSDVAPGNWAFNYVGAASGAGWLNPYWIGVRPGYAFHENYQASWGDAASFFVSAMKQAGKVTLATGQSPMQFLQASGLLQGIPAADQPAQNKYMDRADAAVFLSNVLAWSNGQLLPAGSTVTVTGTTYVAPGSTDQLNLTVKGADGTTITLPKTAEVNFSVDNQNGFFNPNVPGQLVVSTAGTYNVTATVDGVASAPFQVQAFGNLSAIKLSAPSTNVVANGTSTQTITATAVDANGVPITNFNGSATVTVSGTGTTFPSSGQASDFSTSNGTYTVNFTNGVATFAVQAGIVAGLNTTYTVSYTPTGSSTPITANETIATVPQVATALQVTPANKYVAANSVNATGFNVQVVDQTGNPMLNGTWAYNVAVAGPGTLVTPTTGVFSGNGTTTPNVGVVTVNSEQGVTGNITVTVSATGLTSATGSTQAVIAQQAVKYAPSTTTASFAEGNASGAAVTLQAVDAQGYPAVNLPSGNTYTLYVNNSSNSAATNILVNNTAVTASGIVLPGTQSDALTFTDNGMGADAGTYTVTVKDQNGNIWASFPVVVTAAAQAKVTPTVPASYVSFAGAASVPVTLQVQDQYGNNVAVANVPVSVYVNGNMAGTATLNGSSTSSTSPVTVNTDATGKAVVTLDAQAYPGEVYTVYAQPASTATGFASNAVTNSTTVQVQQEVVSTVSTTVAGANGASYVTAGQTVTGTVYLKDAYGNPVTNSQAVSLAVTGGLSIPVIKSAGTTLSGTASPYTLNVTGGYFTFTATATTAGVATVTATDTSFNPNVSGSGTVSVTAGQANSGYAFFNAAGQEITSSNELAVTANTPVEVWLKPVDSEGNPGTSSVVNSAIFSDNGGSGQFRVTSSTNASSTSYMVPAGSAGIPVWYVNSNSGNYNLSATTFAQSSPFTNVATNEYQTTLTLQNGVSVVPNDVSVLGYTYESGSTLTAGNNFIVTGSGSSVTVEVYSTSNLTSNPPTIGYNGNY